jgi:hypothetical protein
LNKSKYDMNNSKRIYNLMILKGKCLQYHNDLMLESCARFNLPSQFACSSFYSSMSDVIDVLLFFFLNDEVSASLPNRGPLGDILACAIDEHGEAVDGLFLQHACQDVQELFKNRTDFIIGSYFLDFTVSSFSVFENSICKVYEEVRERKPSKNGKVKALKKLLNKYKKMDEPKEDEINEIIHKIMKGCSSYVSSAEKFDFVISMLDENYARSKKNDKETINMYRSKRNTIHNLGVHKHESLIPISIRSADILLEKGKPSYTEDYNSNIYICDELVEIYKSIVDNLALCQAESLFKWPKHCSGQAAECGVKFAERP